MSFYVYELVDPRDGAVFYVGKGKRGRIDQHEVEARKGKASLKCDRIREIDEAGLKIQKRKVSTHVDEQAAFDAEAALICEYGLANLTNICPGGNGGASSGPNLYEDRGVVVNATRLFRRMQGMDLGCVNLFGQEVDFRFVRASMEDVIKRVIKRRGLDWVNEIAARYATQYQPVADLA